MDYSYLIIYIYLFLVGASFASFANVAIYRIPKNENITTGRSYCENCHNNIKWYDLIPVISYFILGGKCRYCKQYISIIHPLFECLGGIIAIHCFNVYGISYNAILSFLISIMLLIIAMIDFKTMDIYTSTLIVLIILAIIYRVINSIDLMNILIGSLCISVPMILINLLIPSSFGFGDIELMFISGIMLGWQYNLLATFIGIMSASIYAGILLVLKKVNRKAHIPFGPYLSLGIFIAMLYGNNILSWYLSFII